MFKDLFVKDEGGVQPWILYAAIGIAVIIGGYLVYGSWTEGDKPLKSPWMCMTEGCGHVVDLVPKLGDPAPPLPCPKCGKKSLAIPEACSHCGALVVMNEWRGLPPPTKCPKCGKEIIIAKY